VPDPEIPESRPVPPRFGRENSRDFPRSRLGRDRENPPRCGAWGISGSGPYSQAYSFYSLWQRKRPAVRRRSDDFARQAHPADHDQPHPGTANNILKGTASTHSSTRCGMVPAGRCDPSRRRTSTLGRRRIRHSILVKAATCARIADKQGLAHRAIDRLPVVVFTVWDVGSLVMDWCTLLNSASLCNLLFSGGHVRRESALQCGALRQGTWPKHAVAPPSPNSDMALRHNSRNIDGQEDDMALRHNSRNSDGQEDECGSRAEGQDRSPGGKGRCHLAD
jgi:hypothetical protein